MALAETITTEERFVCPECESSFDEMGERVYECSRCGGTQVEERRCEQCNIFMAKLADESCPECEAPIEETLDWVTVFLTPDGMTHESAFEAVRWMAEAPARAARAVEVKAELDRAIAQRRAEAAERGALWAPRVERVLEALMERWGAHGPGTPISGAFRDLVGTLQWHRDLLSQGEPGGLTIPVSMVALAALMFPGPDIDVVIETGLDYERPYDVRLALQDEVLENIRLKLVVMSVDTEELERVLHYMAFGGSVHVEMTAVVPVLEEVLGLDTGGDGGILAS